MSGCSGVHDGDGCDCPQPPHQHRWSRWAVGYRRQCLDCRAWDEQDRQPPAEAQQDDERCCPKACPSGACETCPCCSAGWCVMGIDGLPDDPEDLALWLEVAAEHNPVAAALAARPSADTETLRRVRALADTLDIDAAEDAQESESDDLDPYEAARKLGQSEGTQSAADALRAALDGDRPQD